MVETKRDYTLSTAALIVLGCLALSGGGAAWTYEDFLWGTLGGAIGLCVALGGVVLVIIGIVRAVRERRENAER